MKNKVSVDASGSVVFFVGGDPGLQRYLDGLWSKWGRSVTLQEMQHELRERYRHFPGDVVSAGDPKAATILENSKRLGGIAYPLKNGVVSRQ